MVSTKKIVCRCEDVTEDELADAIEQGRRDIESLRRFTAIGTGSCQGKTCITHVLDMLSKATGKSHDVLGTMKSRPPIHAVELAVLAEAEKNSKKEK